MTVNRNPCLVAAILAPTWFTLGRRRAAASAPQSGIVLRNTITGEAMSTAEASPRTRHPR